jgi:class 3 adenylate cyclase
MASPGDLPDLHGLPSSLRAESEGPGSGEPASPRGTGTEPPLPVDISGEPLAVGRTFAFVDVCGFTRFCDEHGEHAAVEVLTGFREMVRDVVGRRGVRVAKWLGDGVMIVGTESGPVVAGVAELTVRSRAAGLALHAGVASGTVLLFEGDDYVGRPVNLAARLCDLAGEDEVLVGPLDGPLPDWIDASPASAPALPGVGEVSDVRRLTVATEVAEQFGLGPGVEHVRPHVVVGEGEGDGKDHR